MKHKIKMMMKFLTYCQKYSAIRIAFMIISLFFAAEISAQEEKKDKEQKKAQQEVIRETAKLLSDASLDIAANSFVEGEADYRKAIAINPKSETAKYNLGNAYYNKAKNDEAMTRFQQAADVATVKNDKHGAYHNLGNTYMNAKKYQEAVDAYKNALRNNPTDDETRYNLALAKDMLEKNPPKGGDGDNKDQDKKDKDDKNEDNKDKKDEEGNEKEGNEGDDQEDKDKGDEKDEEKKGENKEEQGKPDKPNEGEKDKKDQKQQQPQPGQMSPQQIQNLLEAMNNEEKKVQEKINAKKQKGAKVKSEKDW